MLGPQFYRITHDLSPNLNAPRMTRVHLEKGMSSCSTGYDSQVSIRSFGEAIERHLSYCDSEVGLKKARICELEDVIAKWFKETITLDIPQRAYENHLYNLVEVQELSTHHIVYAPLVAFTLGKCQDDDFHGYRDSSGTALHCNSIKAFSAARDEYGERQALSLFWYYGHCTAYIHLRSDNIHRTVGSYLPFIEYLMTKGSVYLFEISLIYPVRTILAVFFSKYGPVHFSAGASGNENVKDAIRKALMELYQAYVLMLNLTDKAAIKNIDIDNDLNNGYLSHNNNNYVEKWGFILGKEYLSVNSFDDKPRFIKTFTTERVLFFQKHIVFPNKRKSIYYASLKSIDGFKIMSIDKSKSIVNTMAATHYGYQKPINHGPIAFA